MRIRYSGLFAAAIVAAALPVAAQTVNHYDMSRVGYRNADGQAAYPAGVSDPSGWNPSAPPMESAVPMPPPPDTPIRSVPASTVAAVPAGPPQGSAGGFGTPAYVPGVSVNVPGAPSYASPTQVYPQMAAAAVLAPPASWYTRVDYFHWNEKVGGADFVNESGALFTLGYQRRSGFERYRAELFGGEVHYDGYGQFDGGGIEETLPSNTGYLGLRGEYEMVWEPAAWNGQLAFLAGLGSRFWFRDLHDGTTQEGYPVYGYKETWWTFYPYLGAETHMPLRRAWTSTANRASAPRC